MVKLIAIFAVALALMGAAFASAATMNVNGGVVQAGSDNSLTCQTDTLSVDSWQVFGIGDSGSPVETVTVKGMDGACIGDRLMLGVTAAGQVYHSVDTTGGVPNAAPDPSGSYFHTITSGDIGKTIQFYFAKEGGASAPVKLNPADITGIQFILEGSNK